MDRFSSRLVSLSAMLVQPRSASISPSTVFSLFLTLQLLPEARRYSTEGPSLPSARARASSICCWIAVPFSSYRSARPVSWVQISSMAR